MIEGTYVLIYKCSECSKEFRTLEAASDHERSEHLCKICKHHYSAMGESRCSFDFDCNVYNDNFEQCES